MTPPRNRLADTIRKPAKKKTSTPVEKTLRSNTDEDTKLTRRTTVYLSEKTWTELKVATVQDGKSVSQIMEKLVDDYLKRRERKIAKAQENSTL
jgi:hypothetical protein